MKANRYDLVLMDHMMPGMDGVEAAACIRAWEREQREKKSLEFPKETPIIALTANAVSGMREMFIENGFNDFLAKPIEVSKMDEIITRWIPKEKQIKNRTFETRVEGSFAIPPSALPSIDTAKGITMTGGTVEGYRKVLAQFYKDALERLPLFNSFLTNNGSAADDRFPQGNFAVFITQAHAIKSASATIGAAEVSAEAEKLEAAGKTGDIAAIQEDLPSFVTHLTALVGRIEAALETAGQAPETAGRAPEGDLRDLGAAPDIAPLLRELARVLQAQNAAAIDSIVEELYQKPLDGKTREALDAVSGDVLMAEYGKAGEIVAALLENKTGV
jgi:CheY-like chemotaxis protein